jgi:hypothetical protein
MTLFLTFCGVTVAFQIHVPGFVFSLTSLHRTWKTGPTKAQHIWHSAGFHWPKRPGPSISLVDRAFPRPMSLTLKNWGRQLYVFSMFQSAVRLGSGSRYARCTVSICLIVELLLIENVLRHDMTE